jgi:hypothetical protein
MNTIHRLAVAALLAASTVAMAAPQPDVNLDGSVGAHSAKGPTLAAAAGRQLENANVPSTKTDPIDIKAAADADMNRRQSPTTPRLKAERENLVGKDAARALAQQQKPSTYDRDISIGDSDHTNQYTALKVYLKK